MDIDKPNTPEPEALPGNGDDEAATLASVRRDVADVDAGRTYDADEVFDRLKARYETP